MSLVISPQIQNKLANKTPPVSRDEVLQCFANRTGQLLADTRAEHLTNPITRWFIAETDYGRKLKIVFIPLGEDIIIKSAYVPNAEELRIYIKYGQP